jgi:signal transduction histidine kinase
MTASPRVATDPLSVDTGEHLAGLAAAAADMGRDAERDPAMDPARQLLALQRELAERQLNTVRAVVLLLLTAAAMIYAPNLTPGLNRANVLVLVPSLVWTIAQFVLFYRRTRLPEWLAIANPLVDVAGVTAIMAAYALEQSATLALKSPIFLAYFAILAARPIASSTSKAAAVAVLAVLAYAALLAFLVASGLVIVVANPVSAMASGAISPLDEGAKLLLLAVAGGIATYATAWHERLATSYYRETGTRARLEARLARAQLQSLKLQMHPHFLFNTLNSITTLITEDPPGAERMVTGLSELLRLSLRNAGEQEVPLERELEVLRHYLTIQQIRFQDRLTVDLDVDPETLPAMVPNLMLQPLVENAIRHGIGPRATGGRIEVRVTRVGDAIRLRVHDDGVGTATEAMPVREGTGIGNTRARLGYLYGAQHRFEIGEAPDAGFTVMAEIPFRLAGSDAADSGATPSISPRAIPLIRGAG